MEFNAALAADLALLSAALDEPGADIASTLNQLALDAAQAVSSYFGLSVRMPDVLGPLTMTALDDGLAPVRASVTVPLLPNGASLTLYATHPGAFVDIVADLAWLTGRAISDFALDADLAPRAGPDGLAGLAAQSVVNQAVGVLIAWGHPPDGAEQELARRAATAGVALPVAAETILRDPQDPELGQN